MLYRRDPDLCSRCYTSAVRHGRLARRYSLQRDDRDYITARVRVDENGCWIWTAGITREGYGRSSAARVDRLAHRLSFLTFTGTIPSHLQVDHICNVRACVNPEHLQLLTPRENTLRNSGPSALNARMTHCRAGHEFTDANTYRHRGERHCRACRAEAARRVRARRLSQLAPAG